MAKFISNIKQSLKDTLLFDALYFIIFLFLIGTFSDGSQTTGMFILIDFFVVVLMTLYYFIFNLVILFTGWTTGILIRVLLLFVLVALAVFTLTGQLPVFGLLQKYIYNKQTYSGNKSLDDDVYLFQQTRDFAFSISGLTSAVIFLIIKWLTRNTTVTNRSIAASGADTAQHQQQ